MSIDPDPSQATERGAIPADSYAHRLMLARAHAGHISIRDAADLCGLGRGAWTNWEKGAAPADKVESAKVIAEKLGVDYHWLLFGGQLSQPVGRQLRRRVAEGPQNMTGYVTAPERPPTHTPRQRGNRPPGHPSGSTTPGVARTAYVDRPDRRKRG